MARGTSAAAATAVAATAAAAAAGAAYVVATKLNSERYIVVFPDSASSGVRVSVRELGAEPDRLAALLTRVAELAHLAEPRLFLLQAADKRELHDAADLSAALLDGALSLQGCLLLLATGGGADLSPDAAARPPLRPVPAGPAPLPVLGNALVYLRGPLPIGYNLYTNLFAPQLGARNTWGDTCVLYLPNSAGGAGCDTLKSAPPGMLDWSVTTTDPEVIAELLNRQDDFPKLWGRDALERRLSGFAGTGLFTSSSYDPDWSTAHGLLPRGFNQIRIKNHFPVLLDKTRAFVAAWSRLPPGGRVDNVPDWLTCMTADAVTKAALGLDMGNVEAKAAGTPLHPFITSFRYGLKSAFGRTTVASEFGRLAALNPLFDGKAALARRYEEAVATCSGIVNDLVERTRAGEIGGPNSVLSAMLADVSPSTGKHVRFDNMYGQVINLMIAGHETTAATLSWALYYLSTRPDVEQKALDEISRVLGDRAEPTADDVPKLVYLEAVFREALRLHPAVAVVTRDVVRDTTLKGTYFVRAGQRVDISNVGLHRREDQWGGEFGDPREPSGFNPDRFLPGAAERTGRHANAFNPWGFGARACIGSQFALWEGKLFLCMVLRCFKLKLPSGYVPVPSNADGGAAPTPHHLALNIWRRKGSDALLKSLEEAAAAAAGGTGQAAAAAPSAAAASAPSAAAAAAAGAPGAAAPAAADADAHNTPLLVLYGSNMGTCEELAGALAARAKAAGFAPRVATLDAAVAAAGKDGPLPGDRGVLVVASTYNGAPPDNAAAFAKWLATKEAGSLSHIKAAVFGVGNSQWAQTFCAFPRSVSIGVARAGGQLLLEFASGDVDGNEWQEAFDAWAADAVQALLVGFEVTPPEAYAAAAGAGGAAGAGSQAQRLHVRLLEQAEQGQAVTVEQAIAAIAAARPDDADNYAMLEVLESYELQTGGSARSTRHVQLRLPAGAAGDYRAGDHLEVLPNNDAGLVDAALKVLGLGGDERVEWTTNVDDEGGSARALGGAQKLTMTLTARMVLTWLVDLSAVPGRRIVASLADACPCPPEAARLRALSQEEAHKADVAGRRLTLVELLQQFRSAVPAGGLPQLVNLLPRLAPRYYSISSSPLARPGTCSVTVGRVQYTTPTGRVHKGAASAAVIAAAPVGAAVVGCVRRLSSSFRLPEDHSTPVIMIGPGTGVAPMMGFLQERAALQQQGSKLGPAVLFFGCRAASEDYIYREQLEEYLASGVLTGLHVAFSRDGPTKVYVQDLIQQQADEMWGLLERGAHVYVCGDARRMAPDVRAAFRDVAAAAGGRSGPAADAYVGSLLEGKRYLEDVWAG